MYKKWVDRTIVEKRFSLTRKQLNRIADHIKKRHPLEIWTCSKYFKGKREIIINEECIEWLQEVYFNKSKHYLELEIDFYKKQIKKLEQELKIPPMENEYYDMSMSSMRYYLPKSKSAISVAVHRLQKQFPYSVKYSKNDYVVIKKEGIKWLFEHYWKKEYLLLLESYKHKLENIK